MPADHSGLVARLGRLTAAALAALVLWLPAGACLGQIMGFGARGYHLALIGLAAVWVALSLPLGALCAAAPTVNSRSSPRTYCW